MISIILRTFNRGTVIHRAIESILAQSYPDLEIIIVDDGSTDNTIEIVSLYKDPRIRIYQHGENKGKSAATHTGLDNIQGEWFTLLDSDDEIIPDALKILINIPQLIDSGINAISCNCVDSQTGRFSGTGIDIPQYLDAKTIVQKCRGEFWGITKTELLQGILINDELQDEGPLWHKINKKAKRFYIHQGLRVYHTEGDDRLSKNSSGNSLARLQRRYKAYLALLKEHDYLNDYYRWGQDNYRDIHFNAGLCFIKVGDKLHTYHCIKELLRCHHSLYRIAILFYGLVLGSDAVEQMKSAKKQHLKFKFL